MVKYLVTGYPYHGCVQGEDFIEWDRKFGEVANSYMGAEDCAFKCKEGGYKYWGLECPRATMFCQCGVDGMLDKVTYLPDQKCKEYNVDSQSKHCSGPYTSSMNGVGYFHGAAQVSSVYLTDNSGW